MDSDIGATATLVQQQHQTLDGNHYQGQKEQDNVNGTVESAEGHSVDRFRGEAGCSVKEIAVVAPDNDSVGDSSTQCSDVIDDDNEEEETDVEESGAGGWIMNPPVSTIVQQHQAFDTTNGYIAFPNLDSSNFSDVRVKDSSNVHLGNEVNYNGPVTIHVNHVVYTSSSTQDESKPDASAFDITPDLSTSKDNESPNGCIFPQSTNLNKVTQWLWTWKWHMALLCIALILLGIIVFITVHLVTRDPDDASTPPTTPTPATTVSWEIPDSSTEGNNGTEFRIVERDEWGARPPLKPLKEMKLPVSYVIICEVLVNFCTTQPKCAEIVRIVQDYDMLGNNVADIAYNFLVGGDGLAYVGRNWNYIGGHSGNYNGISIGIAFIGAGFTSVIPSKRHFNAAKELIEFGVRTGKIASDYKLLGQRQVWNNTIILFPADALYNQIKKWPHWSSEP